MFSERPSNISTMLYIAYIESQIEIPYSYVTLGYLTSLSYQHSND